MKRFIIFAGSRINVDQIVRYYKSNTDEITIELTNGEKVSQRYREVYTWNADLNAEMKSLDDLFFPPQQS